MHKPFKTRLGSLAAAFVLGAMPLSAGAQNGAWEQTASIYLFTAETTTGIGDLEAELSFSDALENLDFAFMGAFETSNGRISLIADYMRTDLGFGFVTPGAAFSGVDADLKTQVLSGYVAYRVVQRRDVSVDLAAGFRWFETETTLTPVGGAPVAGRSVSENWTDPLIGVRSRFALSDRWFGTVMADYGGFSSDSETWQVLLTAGYEINDNWVLQGGYRYLDVEHDINGNRFRFTQSGPVFGASYRF
jgi:opacity protein-like surface antigen